MEGTEEFVKFSKLANYVEVGKNRNEFSRKYYSELFGKLFPSKQSCVRSLDGTVEASCDGGRSSSTSKRAQSTTNVVDEYSRGITLYGQGIGSTPCYGYSPVLSQSGSAVSSEMVADADLGYSRTEQQKSSFETGGASRDGGRSSSTSKRSTPNYGYSKLLWL